MRKWVIAGVVVIVVAGAGYLGAQAYSSQRFDSEIDKLVERLDANPEWQVSREDVDRGWFHSTGRIEARYLATAQETGPIVVDLPYRAGHGLLETTLSGDAQVRIGDDQTLFGDVIESNGPMTWNGRFLTREQKLETRLTMPSFSQSVTLPAREIDGEVTPARDMQLDFEGMTLDLEQVDDRLALDGKMPRLRMADEQSDILIEDTTLSGAFQGDDQAFHQTMTFTLPTITVTPTGNPSVVSKNVSYAVDATLSADQLAMQLQVDLGDTQVQDQSIFNGGFSMTLDHVDGDAYRALAAALDENLTDIQAAVDADDDEALAAALTPLRPSVLAILAGSPHLSLDSLTANSAMLGMKMRGNGELGVEGSGIEEWNLDKMSAETLQREFLRRLDGNLTLEGAPAMLMMTLGLPLSSDPLRVELADGVLDINGQQMPLLPPDSTLN